MSRFLAIAAIIVLLLFIVKQLSRLRPTERDKQLQALREAATRSGLLVRFWTLRASSYQMRCGLPDSGFSYVLAWPPQYKPPERWSLWLSGTGAIETLSGHPSHVAYEWLESFHLRFADSWALLEITDTGIALLWQERGTVEDIANIASALNDIMKTVVKTIQ